MYSLFLTFCTLLITTFALASTATSRPITATINTIITTTTSTTTNSTT